jgi:hypothetical protein
VTRFPTVAICAVALTVRMLAAPDAAHAQARSEPANGQFVLRDSTLVVLVPANAEAVSVLGAVSAVADRDVTSVYTTDDVAARRLARALANTVGGSLVPYDRVERSADHFATVLFENAVGANPNRTVLVVVEPNLVQPFYRTAAAAVGVPGASSAAPGGAANGILVLTVAPRSHALIRARY